jgi:hypothetical protein
MVHERRTVDRALDEVNCWLPLGADEKIGAVTAPALTRRCQQVGGDRCTRIVLHTRSDRRVEGAGRVLRCGWPSDEPHQLDVRDSQQMGACMEEEGILFDEAGAT